MYMPQLPTRNSRVHLATFGPYFCNTALQEIDGEGILYILTNKCT